MIQDEGDSIKAIDNGTRYARQMQQAASQQQRVEVDVSELMIGLNCGGSDTTSGLVANPALGIASDKLVAQGGSSILTELTELIGTEHILARRAVNEQVAGRYSAGDRQHGGAAEAPDAALAATTSAST